MPWVKGWIEPCECLACQLEGIEEYLRIRANDPWDDALWPAANKVLTMVARELEGQYHIRERPKECFAHAYRNVKPE